MLTRFTTDSRDLNMMQTSWAALLDPILLNPVSKVSILQNVQLVAGPNQINHLLGRNLQGWFIVRQRGLASLCDFQDSNPTPQLTLVLFSTDDVVCNVAVF